MEESRGIATKSRNPRTGNGYEVKVEKRSLPSREIVEAQLQSTTESISSRLESIQSEITSTGDSVRDVFSARPYLAVATALSIGIAIGYSGGRDKNSSAAEGLAKGVSEAIRSGVDPEIALRTTLEKIPGLANKKSVKQRSALGSVTSSLIKVGLGLALQRLPTLFSSLGDEEEV